MLLTMVKIGTLLMAALLGVHYTLIELELVIIAPEYFINWSLNLEVFGSALILDWIASISSCELL